MTKTLVVINPYAAGGQALTAWESVQEALRQKLDGDIVPMITHDIAILPDILRDALAQDVTQVLSMGGDGTNHILVNALVRHNQAHPQQALVYGVLPAGTGQDWARGVGMPMNTLAAVDWLVAAQPRPIDVGHVLLDDDAHYFLNISSVGLSFDVASRVNATHRRRPWTFLRASVMSILNYEPRHVRIELDGAVWYDEKTYLAVVANGSTFGQGMRVAPEATIDDGLFDVVTIDAVSRLTLLSALQLVYRGKHLSHPNVHMQRAKQVRITSDDGPLGLDLDGEAAQGDVLTYEIQAQQLQMLLVDRDDR